MTVLHYYNDLRTAVHWEKWLYRQNIW